MGTRLIVVRHCEAQGNLERVFQGHWNGDVTPNGQAQLERLSVRMQDFPFDFLYSSPLIRAYKTARAANAAYGKPITILKSLSEINGGHWEGKKWADFPKMYPEESRIWNLEPHRFHPQGGEPMRQVYDRMAQTAVLLAKRHQGKSVCVASHGCAIRNLLCFAKGWSIERLNEVEWCDNTAISVIEFDEGLHPRLILENDSSHLSEALSTLNKQSWWRKENREKMIFE